MFAAFSSRDDEFEFGGRKSQQQHDLRSSPTSTMITDLKKETINLPLSPTRSMIRRCSKSNLMDDEEDDFSSLEDGCDGYDDETTYNRGMLHGVLASGVQYEATKILMEGWMHKKGSGNDIFGSVRWKERFCRLILAEVEGISVQVPLLLVFWYDFSFSEPSTIITLWDSSTVCMAVDNGNANDAWNYRCFNIIHCAKDNSSNSNIRTFTCHNRDKWVYEINQALYNYEKERSTIREKEVVLSSMNNSTSSLLLPLRPISPPPPPNSLWSGDQYVAYDDKDKIPSSPPISPRTTLKKSNSNRPSLPRHPSSDRLTTKPRPDVLLGEALIS